MNHRYKTRVPGVTSGRFLPLNPLALAAVLTLGAALPFSLPAAAAAQASGLSIDQRSGQVLRRPVPDENTLARLVWGTMVALDNANRTENYSVFYQLGTPAFQARNSPAQLAQTFAPLRERRVDIGRAVLSTPTYYIPPSVDAQGRLRLRGGFDYRPRSIRFDLLFSQQNGGWRITGVSVVEMSADAPK